MSDLLGVEEASRACRVSRDTIWRRLRKGEFEGAVRGPRVGSRPGPWLIPVEDLAAAGLEPWTLRVRVSEQSGDLDLDDPVALRIALAHQEAIAVTREAHLVDLRAELRRLHDLLTRCAWGVATLHDDAPACGDCHPFARPHGQGSNHLGANRRDQTQADGEDHDD